MSSMHRCSIPTWFLLAGVILPCGLRAEERTASRPPIKIVELDENSELLSAEAASELAQVLLAGGGEGSCQSVGSTAVQASGQFRYRANAILVEATDVELQEFKMLLRFTGNENLSFSVHEQQLENNGIWVEQFQRTIVGAPGTGAAQLYSSGVIAGGLKLKANTQYAIGVSWGARTITFFRNALTHPQDLEGRVGQALGLVSLNGIEPPLDEQVPGLVISTAGSYALEYCFKPVAGACCSSTADPIGCRTIGKIQCTGDGSYFHGERIPCTEVNCRFGACCSPCANQCFDDYTPEACAAPDVQGMHHRNAVCPPLGSEERAELCPIITGACCVGGTCVPNKCVDDCVTIGGTYRGDGSSCEPDICKGACCSSTQGCTNQTGTVCTNFIHGTYKGDGTRCDRLPPEDECGGACCFNAGVSGCQFVFTRAQCTEIPGGVPNAVYKGDGTSCATMNCYGGPNSGEICTSDSNMPVDQCPDGSCKDCPNIGQTASCCLPNGTCLNTNQLFCEEVAGGVAGTIGIKCSDLDIPACPVQACCFEDGTCESLTADGCDRFGGVSAASCSPSACSAVLAKGACCAASGNCSRETSAACLDAGGQYQGDSASQDPCATLTCPGFGACCTDDGLCTEAQTESRCDLLGGTYGQDGSTCLGGNVDCDDRGACCKPSGGCEFLGVMDCATIGGTHRGEETFCETTGICPTGACCQGDGICTIRGIDACDDPENGLVYQGTGSSCTPGRCTLGACCSGGICKDDQVLSQCFDPTDVFSPDTACTPDACEVGACCLPTFDGSCQDLSRLECLIENGTYRTGLTCDLSGDECTLGACCELDGTCTSDRFAFLCPAPSEFREAEACGVQDCDPRGACCLPESASCTILTEIDCTAQLGVYAGDGAPCAEETCAAGACCLPGRQCVDTSGLDCAGRGGTYSGVGTGCKTTKCPLDCSEIIASTDPPNCAIDAGYPHTPQETPARLRWKTFDLTFECDPGTLEPEDFELREEPPSELPRTIVNVSAVEGEPNTRRVELNQFIKLGVWTCIKHVVSGEESCFGLLSGDVNGNGILDHVSAVYADRDALVADLEDGVVDLPLRSCDVNRTGACHASDIIDLIDLFNAAPIPGEPGMSLPACPSAPVP